MDEEDFNDQQSGNDNNDEVEKGTGRMGNRLSFDFCELRAEQLLEPNPTSHHEDRIKGQIFEYPKNRLQNRVVGNAQD